MFALCDNSPLPGSGLFEMSGWTLVLFRWLVPFSLK